jgi:hypothetical protein
MTEPPSAEVRPAEVCPVEVRLTETHDVELLPAEVRRTKVRANARPVKDRWGYLIK